MDTDTVVRGVKIACGSAAAIFLAERAGLAYAASTGIITLLTIQDTRRGTFRMASQRLVSFGVTMLLSLAVSVLFGYHAAGFGIFLLCFVQLSYVLHWEAAVSTNAVFATHVFMTEKLMTPEFVRNEIGILFIGTGMAVLLNLKTKDRGPGLSQELVHTERRMQKLLFSLAADIRQGQDTGRLCEALASFRAALEEDIARAVRNKDNTLREHSGFYVYYFVLRKKQCVILSHICRVPFTNDCACLYAPEIADFFYGMAESFGIKNKTGEQLVRLQRLLARLSAQPQPACGADFSQRAQLYYGLKEMEEFLKLKQRFYARLTSEQRRLYLK